MAAPKKQIWAPESQAQIVTEARHDVKFTGPARNYFLEVVVSYVFELAKTLCSLIVA